MVDVWTEETRRLLALEWNEELNLSEAVLDTVPSYSLQALGVSLLGITLESAHSGFFGRTVAVFSRINGLSLPTHTFSCGDVVRCVDAAGRPFGNTCLSGVVSKCHERFIEIVFNEQSSDAVVEIGKVPVRIDKLPHEATHKRQLRAVDAVATLGSSHPAYKVRQVIFGECPPTEHAVTGVPLRFFSNDLNEPQEEAVDKCMRSRDVVAIHGPPGTGKTTTVVEIIRQAVQVQGLRVLVCAPSNVAVDNIIMRLAKCKLRMVRLGHPARLLPDVARYSLDAVVSRLDSSEIVNDVRKDLQKVLSTMSKPTKSKKGASRKVLYAEAKELRKELRNRQHKAAEEAVLTADVVLATNTGVSGIHKLVKDVMFDIVIIDEAAQALEASCWIPILLGRRVILAGDHQQLPPTIKSEVASKGILGQTLFDKVAKLQLPPICLLSIQYRMNSVICQWASHEMYKDKLLSDVSVANRLLDDIQDVSSDLQALMMIDTACCGMSEQIEGEESDDSDGILHGSKFNKGEAEIVVSYVGRLVESGLKQREIAVISPYSAQVHLIRSHLGEMFPDVEVKTVDGFQGREKEAVVLSLVRSNEKGMVGFLSDERRMNVAITRAKRHVCLICDSDTIGRIPGSFLHRMVEYFQDHGELEIAGSYSPTSVFKTLPDIKRSTQKMKQLPAVSARRTEELRDQVSSFAELGSGQQLEFPPTLTSQERKIVHEAAEKSNLIHSSKGEGASRYIVVNYKLKPKDREMDKPVIFNLDEVEESMEPKEIEIDEKATLLNVDDVTMNPKDVEMDEKTAILNSGDKQNDTEDIIPEGAKESPMSLEEFSKTYLPGKYQELVASGSSPNDACFIAIQETQSKYREIHGVIQSPVDLEAVAPEFEKSDLEKAREIAAAKYHLSKQPVQKKVVTKKKKSDVVKKLPDEKDPDALLDALLASKNICGMECCKDSVRLIGQDCKYCSTRYCFKHAMPEVHGCTGKVREDAKKEFRAQAPLNQRHLQTHQRNALKKYLAGKITEANEQRSKKEAKSKKKKK